ncbi:MAG: hypothetical protein DHS20C21_16760 [Gemmatimonadota bacterium]|nr:MAG: hypothetical protein DHS20C21_16760 [Gemmatimonadota bacterium]
MERRHVFDTIASQYDRFRPGYPGEVMDRIVSLSGVTARSRILEVGPGTGQATRLLVARGLPVVCLEEGEHLARQLRETFATHAGVQVEQISFEDWPEPRAPFDLLLAAQSFHHLDRAIRLKKAARLLAPDGSLALIWNIPVPGDTELAHAVEAVYRKHGAHVRATSSTDAHELETEVAESGLFQSPDIIRLRWHQSYESAEYIGLLATHSDHALLPESERSELLGAVARVVDEHGGVIEVHRETYLYHAKVR